MSGRQMTKLGFGIAAALAILLVTPRQSFARSGFNVTRGAAARAPARRRATTNRNVDRRGREERPRLRQQAPRQHQVLLRNLMANRNVRQGCTVTVIITQPGRRPVVLTRQIHRPGRGQPVIQINWRW